MKCKACGKKISIKSDFCKFCGSKQIAEVDSNAADPVYAKLIHTRKQIFRWAIPVITIALLYMVASSAVFTYLYFDNISLNKKYTNTNDSIATVFTDISKLRKAVDKNEKLIEKINFTIGSSADEVRAVMGSPDSIKPLVENVNDKLLFSSRGYTGKEIWTYGKSEIIFHGATVCSYKNLGKNLKLG